MRPTPTLVLLAALLAATACDKKRPQTRFRDTPIDLYAVYPEEAWSETNTQGLRRVLLDPDYVLVISEANKLTLRTKDLEDIQVSADDQFIHLAFIFARSAQPSIESFTTHNSNAYIAVMVDGRVRNIARIHQPVRNGRILFTARRSRLGQVQEFVRLFLL